MSKLEQNNSFEIEGQKEPWAIANFKLNFIVLFLKFDICFVWQKNQGNYCNLVRKICE